MKLRRFTPDGIQVFREFLAECRRNPETEAPADLLEHRTLTEVVTPECQVALHNFETKGEAAKYLHAVLQPLNSDELSKDAGLWTWLSLLLFDSLVQTKNNTRILRADHHYIFEPHSNRNYYRHLLFISWRVVQLSPIHNRLFLQSRLNTRDQMTDEVMQRLFLTRIPSMFEVLDRLYWDSKSKKTKHGMVSGNQPGSLRYRLPLRIRQLEKNYDLMSLSADQLLELLGDEFSFARRDSLKLIPAEIEA